MFVGFFKDSRFDAEWSPAGEYDTLKEAQRELSRSFFYWKVEEDGQLVAASKGAAALEAASD